MKPAVPRKHRFPRLLLPVWVLFLLSFGVAGGSGPDREKTVVDLGRHQWKNRLLLIFASSASDPAYSSLKAEIDGRKEGIRERDLIVGGIFEKGESYLAGVSLSSQDAARLRFRFSVQSGRFAAILIGKDGGVKLREEKPVSLAEVFALIDSMPMREREIEDRQKPERKD